MRAPGTRTATRQIFIHALDMRSRFIDRPADLCRRHAFPSEFSFQSSTILCHHTSFSSHRTCISVISRANVYFSRVRLLLGVCMCEWGDQEVPSSCHGRYFFVGHCQLTIRPSTCCPDHPDSRINSEKSSNNEWWGTAWSQPRTTD